MAYENTYQHYFDAAPRMLKHKCRFRDDWESAELNEKWFKHYRWDLVKAVDRQKGTIAHPGSEFREMSVVEELWKDHESWTKMKSIMTDGVDYPLVDIVEEDRRNDLDHMIKCGNLPEALSC